MLLLFAKSGTACNKSRASTVGTLYQVYRGFSVFLLEKGRNPGSALDIFLSRGCACQWGVISREKFREGDIGLSIKVPEWGSRQEHFFRKGCGLCLILPLNGLVSQSICSTFTVV